MAFIRTAELLASRTVLGAGLITRSGFFREAPSGFIKIFDWATNDLLGVAETVRCPPLTLVQHALRPKQGGRRDRQHHGCACMQRKCNASVLQALGVVNPAWCCCVAFMLCLACAHQNQRQIPIQSSIHRTGKARHFYE